MHFIFNQLHCKGNGFLDGCGLGNKGSVTSKLDHHGKLIGLITTNQKWRPTQLSSVRWFIIKKTMRAPKLESSQLGRPTIIAPDPPTDKIGADADEQRRYVLPSFLSRVPTPFRRYSPPPPPRTLTQPTQPTNPTSTSFFWFGCLHQSLRSLGKEEKLKRGTPNEIRVRVPISEHRRRMRISASCKIIAFFRTSFLNLAMRISKISRKLGPLPFRPGDRSGQVDG